MKVFRAAVLLVALAIPGASSIATPAVQPHEPSVFAKIVKQIRHVIGLDDIGFPKP